MCLSWTQNAKVIVGYSFGRNVHFPSISDLIERPLLIVKFIICSLKLFFSPYELLHRVKCRVKIGRILFNLPILFIGIKFSDFCYIKLESIYIFGPCLCDFKWESADLSLCVFLCCRNFILWIPTFFFFLLQVYSSSGPVCIVLLFFNPLLLGFSTLIHH